MNQSKLNWYEERFEICLNGDSTNQGIRNLCSQSIILCLDNDLYYLNNHNNINYYYREIIQTFKKCSKKEL